MSKSIQGNDHTGKFPTQEQFITQKLQALETELAFSTAQLYVLKHRVCTYGSNTLKCT